MKRKSIMRWWGGVTKRMRVTRGGGRCNEENECHDVVGRCNEENESDKRWWGGVMKRMRVTRGGGEV